MQASVNRVVLIGSIVVFLAAILFLGFFLFPSSLAMAQLQQQQQQQTTTTTITTTTPPSSSLSITTIPPLTPEEQEQQNRLQSVIAATTANLNETEKQVSGIVYTPRWSEPVWVNANSVAVLIAYCLPGEFADSGQEILGGFELEVLESYAVALPQGFMAWMAVVGNEDNDVQNGRRLPAALGVICASDLNNTNTRILSPEEQQEINNVISQFTTIQNTQITNIDQVVNVINNVTEPTTTEGQPLRAEIIITNTTRVIINNSTLYEFDADVTGGTPPYNYHWRWIGPFGPLTEGSNRSFGAFLQLVGTHTFILDVTDSKNQTASDTLQITVGRTPTNDTGTTTEGQPLTAKIITNATEAYTPAFIKLDANIFGGTPPYSYTWSVPNVGLIDQDRSITQMFFEPGIFTYILTARDSTGQTASDTVQIVIQEGQGVLPPPITGGEGQPPGGGLLPGIAPGGEEEQPQAPPPTVPEGEEEPTTGGGEEDTGGTPPETGEELSPPSPPPDDTGEEEEEGTQPSPPTEEEPTNPPGG